MHKAIIVPLSLVFAATTLSACQSGSATSGQDAPAASAAQFQSDRTVTIWVKGMTCPFCASNLETYFETVDGMEQVDADLGTGRVLVQLAAIDDSTEAVLRKAVDNSGFSVDKIEFPN